MKDRASFNREKLARCLYYFARLYHNLINLPTEIHEGNVLWTHKDLKEAEANIHRVEEYCMIPMHNIRKHLEEAHRSLLEGDDDRAYFEARYAIDELLDWIRKEGRFD